MPSLLEKAKYDRLDLLSDPRFMEPGRRNDDCVDLSLLNYIIICVGIDPALWDSATLQKHWEEKMKEDYEKVNNSNTESYSAYKYYINKINTIWPYLKQWLDDSDPLRYLTETWKTTIYRKED